MKLPGIYDYKIYVTGPFQSGKTTLIHVLDPYAVSVDRPLPRPYRGESGTTTTGFDLGRVMWIRSTPDDCGELVPKKDFDGSAYPDRIVRELEFRGVPGPLHFKFVRDTMRSNSNLVFLVVDASDAEQQKDAVEHLQEVRMSFRDLPFVVLANKQDRDDAVSPETVAGWLGVDTAFGISTRNEAECKSVIAKVLSLHLS